MFYFNPVNDIDLDSYAYQLYDIPNPTSLTTPIASGKNKANVFTISVTNSTDSTPKTYYGRVAVVNSAGTVGTYTSLVSSGATPLIGNQYISELTAAKITTGTLGAHEITLGGATSIIKSSTYNFASPTTGWFIQGDGRASIGGPNGINFNGSTTAPAITLGSNVTIESGVAVPNSSGVAFTGLTITTAVGSVGGIQLGSDANNQWLTSGYFRTGNSSKYLLFNPAGSGSLTINGTVVQNGTVGGMVAGTSSIYLGANTYANANTPFYVDTSSRFSLGDKLYFNGTNLTVGGTINATGGNFSGTITSGGAHFGVMVPGGGYYKGLNLSPDSNTQFQSCFIRGDGGEVYLRADNGSQWIKFENGSVQINAVGFNLSGGSATFSGTINAGTINGTTINGSSIVADSSILVGTSTSLGYLKLATNDNVIVNGMKFQNRQYAGWNASFYPYADAVSDLSVVTNPSLGVYRWDNIYYVGTIADQSDMRSKNTIEDSDLGLDFINMLRPVSYFKNAHKKIPREDDNGNYLRDENENMICDTIPGKRRHYGLIAQEVRQVISDLGKTSMDFSGWGQHDPDDPESEQTLSYLAFISPAIKAIQELSAKVDELESRLV
jgi:hypothetical protein